LFGPGRVRTTLLFLQTQLPPTHTHTRARVFAVRVSELGMHLCIAIATCHRNTRFMCGRVLHVYLTGFIP